MCGIAGMFAYHYAAPLIHQKELLQIRDSMNNRGPDGSGSWFSSCKRVGLGHKRLAIIDLSERAHQPMVSSDGQAIISFNGEIYNYKELRVRLERKGIRFVSDSDTEVLLQLYADKGEAMLRDLRGMFAFILWDEKRKSLLMVRDPYGIKPLYYADDGWTVRIASQVKALLANPHVSKSSCPAGTAGFFLFGSVPEPFTLYRHVRSVPAGSYIWINERGVQAPNAYFSLPTALEEVDKGENEIQSEPENQIRQLRDALMDSVRHHFEADVPVGWFLSSGLDSTCLLELAKECGIGEVETVTVGFEEFADHLEDEVPLASAYARSLGMKHRVCLLSADDVRTKLDGFFGAMDQPSIDGLNQYLISESAADSGLKAAISGIGGDELFGGYPSFSDIPRWLRYAGLPGRIPVFDIFFRKGVQSLSNLLKMPVHPKTAGLLTFAKSEAGAYFLKRGLFMPWELPDLIGKEMAHEGLRRLEPVRFLKQALEPGISSQYMRILCLESSFYLRNQLLRDADWAGMAHSIEIRTPLVDVFLLKRMVPLLKQWGKGPHKRMLAACAKNIPSSILNRKKTGFGLPMGRWLSNKWNDPAWKRIGILSQENCPWSRRWAYEVYRRGLVNQ